MDTEKKKYASAMARFMNAKRKKSELINELEVMIKDEYEKETGLKANYFFAM